MNYIILDLEWNQPLSPQRMIREPFNLGGEIIQIGAAKIDGLEELNITDRYMTTVACMCGRLRCSSVKWITRNIRMLSRSTDSKKWLGNEPFPDRALCLYFIPNFIGIGNNGFRNGGFTVRPVME